MGRAFEYRRAAKEKDGPICPEFFQSKLHHNIGSQRRWSGSRDELKIATSHQPGKSKQYAQRQYRSCYQRAEGKDGADFVEVSYEGKGPHGVLCVCGMCYRQYY